MRKRIAMLSLALATVMSLTLALSACGEGSALGLPTQQAGPTDGPSASQPAPTGAQTTQPVSPSDEPLSPALKPGPSAGVTLVSDDHSPYIKGVGSGCFSPSSYITRGEIAVILYRLLSDTVPVTVSYTDVPENSWYTDAAEQLGSLGVIRPNEKTFNGGDAISRGEFVSYIACFFPMRTDAEQFPDVRPGHPYASAILSARAWGWVVGVSGGGFNPDGTLSRSEAVTIINRALGRTGDRAEIAESRPALFLDVPVNQWYYYDVMEATVPHEFSVSADGAEDWTSFTPRSAGLPADFRTEGFHLYNGWSYYYSEDTKDIVRSSTVSGFPFDANGHFTTGDAGVDGQLRELVLSQTNSSMTRDEMLRAFFAYCRDTYRYLKWNYYNPGDTSFTLDAARHMLSTGRGNCYCYASVFWYLARWLGYDAKIFSGGVLNGPHGWVEIDGYIYDTQLEWRYVHDWGRTQYLWTFYHLLDTNDTFLYRK